MATITINVPAGRATEYLEYITEQIEAGMTSGHVDRDNNWSTSFDDGEDADDLA